jgi:hypothetical protein
MAHDAAKPSKVYSVHQIMAIFIFHPPPPEMILRLTNPQLHPVINHLYGVHMASWHGRIRHPTLELVSLYNLGVRAK